MQLPLRCFSFARGLPSRVLVQIEMAGFSGGAGKKAHKPLNPGQAAR
jgi:hypothetical protein